MDEFRHERRTRGVAMRQAKECGRIRARRRRLLPTEHCHAALPGEIRVTREYQSDSSSKRPGSSALSASTDYGLEETEREQSPMY